MARRRNHGDVSEERSEDDKIVLEAQQRFKRWRDWESDFQTLYRDDVKFANGDSDNGWQWPRDLRQEREKNKRPALTINKTRKKVDDIVNDARQNKPSVSIKPMGEETSFMAAQVWEGLVRQIEYESNAQSIYDKAVESQVEGGIGFWRVDTKFLDDDTFDQSIVIGPVQDAMGVALDPDIMLPDGSDAMWGMVFTDISHEEAEHNPEYKDIDFSPQATAIGGPDTWIRNDSVRVAEYFRIKLTDDELVWMVDPEGNEATFFRSDIPKAYRKTFAQMEKDGVGEIKTRPVQRRKLEYYKIGGNTIISRELRYKDKYIPIVRVVGVERVIDGQLHRYGHVRHLKDPQRMYNYNSSGQVEYGALATKSPWVGDKKAFEGNEVAWNNANVQNAAYLTVNTWDYDLDRPIPMPVRPEAPGSSPAFLEGMRIADHEMDMVSGQYEASEGRQGNEKSGRAIAERQRKGENSNYQYIDHLALAIRLTGRIILDKAPQVYDTKRVIQIMGRDGQQSNITIKPDLDKVMEQKKVEDVVQIMFNPQKGKYLVEADVGPAYATQRQEAWNAFVQIITGAPELINEIGDLMFRSADFPLADKIAERLRKKLQKEKPYLFDDEAPTPAMQGLKLENEQLTQQVAELLQQLAEKRLKLIGREQLRDVQTYDAISKRITAISNAQPELEKTGQEDALRASILKVLEEALVAPDLNEEVDALDSGMQQPGSGVPGEQAAAAQGAAPPVQGARQAKDGNWYVQHGGRHYRVDPAQMQ